MNHEAYLLIVDVPPDLEEQFVDFLLALAWRQSFSCMPANIHDADDRSMSLAEQVSGYRRKVRFQIFIEKTNISGLLTKLKADFAGAGLKYWLLPALERGKI